MNQWTNILFNRKINPLIYLTRIYGFTIEESKNQWNFQPTDTLNKSIPLIHYRIDTSENQYYIIKAVVQYIYVNPTFND